MQLLRDYPNDEFVLFSSYSRSRRRKLESRFGEFRNLEVKSVLPNRLALGEHLTGLILPLRRAILEHFAASVDILHLTRPFAEGIAAGNTVITVQDLFPLTLDDYKGDAAWKEFRNMASYAINGSGAIIVPSRYTADQLAGMYPEAQGRINVIPLAAGRGFRHYDDAPPLSLEGILPQGGGYFIYVGSAYPRKNLLRVLGAYHALPEPAGRDYSLVLVLTGASLPLKEFMEKNSDDLGSSGVIVLHGVSQDELARLYSSAAALVFPSLDEGFGLPVVEAMQSGCPVITSDISCLPEVAGDAAVLVDPHSVSSISDAMLRTAEDPAVAERLRKKGLLRARQFSWQKTAQLTMEVYRNTACSG